jgi:hypothetical protein
LFLGSGQNISAQVMGNIIKELPLLIQESDLTIAQVGNVFKLQPTMFKEVLFQNGTVERSDLFFSIISVQFVGFITIGAHCQCYFFIILGGAACYRDCWQAALKCHHSKQGTDCAQDRRNKSVSGHARWVWFLKQ